MGVRPEDRIIDDAGCTSEPGSRQVARERNRLDTAGDSSALGPQRLTIVGSRALSGAYVLGIRVPRPIEIVFGRYRGAQPIAVAEGACVYVGSALGPGAALWHRLARHACRSDGRPVHDIHGLMVRHALRLGADDRARSRERIKQLRWHVDYLLDDRVVSLERVVALRTHRRLEPELAARIEGHAAVSHVAPGLGAGDAPGSTHLWWAPALCDVWPHVEASAQTLAYGRGHREGACTALD